MRELTRQEEIAIVKMVQNDKCKFIHAGSSRAAYEVSPAILTFLDLPADTKAIVKITYCIEGMNQTILEVSTYSHDENQDLLAKIYAYGDFITIQEKVITCDDIEDEWYTYSSVRNAYKNYALRNLEERVTGTEKESRNKWLVEHLMQCIIGANRYTKLFDAEKIEKADIKELCDFALPFIKKLHSFSPFYYKARKAMNNIADSLSSILGYTEDNEQVGYSEARGVFVSYDYGYTPELDTNEQVGDISSVLRANSELLFTIVIQSLTNVEFFTALQIDEEYELNSCELCAYDRYEENNSDDEENNANNDGGCI